MIEKRFPWIQRHLTLRTPAQREVPVHFQAEEAAEQVYRQDGILDLTLRLPRELLWPLRIAGVLVAFRSRRRRCRERDLTFEG